MSARRRRRGARGSGGGHADERWMASYMDMVTVLMCLFIVLYAMSTVDQQKFQELKNSLASGFGVTQSENVDRSAGVVVPAELVEEDGEGFTDADRARAEVEDLRELQQRLNERLSAQGLQDRVSYRIDTRGLTVKLVGTETFFEPNNAGLRPDARAVLDAVGPVLGDIANEISIEGHADPRGSSAPFPTDWELSSGRATSVLRHLVEVNRIAGPRIASVSYGSARPVGEEITVNRRVDIVVLSDETEDVRALIPGILDEVLASPAAGTRTGAG